MGRIFTVTLPDIGEGVVEGEVVEWRKNVGETLHQDEPVVLVMTDKATVELPAPHPGKLAKQYYQPGGIAIKDQPLYDIELEDQAIEDATADKNDTVSKLEVQIAPEKAPPMPAPIQAKLKPEIKEAGQLPGCQTKLAIPKVRKLAKQLGIPLSEIVGSGKDGRINPEDLGSHRIQKAVPAATPCHLPGDKELPLIGVKALMAKKMVQSKSLIPHFSYFDQVDSSRLVQLKNNLKEKANGRGIHLTYMPFIIKAISLCINKHPLLNSSFDAENNKVILHQVQNIGIAMATSLGLIVPVLKGIEAMSIEALIFAYEDLIKRAQAGKLLPNDMKESTFTITNFGSVSAHGLWATPVINCPEAAILGIGRIQPQPIIKQGDLVVRDVLNLSWSFDHRIIDGEAAALISKTFCSLIENPAALL